MTEKETGTQKKPKIQAAFLAWLGKIIRPETLSKKEPPLPEFPRSAFCKFRPKKYPENFGS